MRDYWKGGYTIVASTVFSGAFKENLRLSKVIPSIEENFTFSPFTNVMPSSGICVFGSVAQV